MCSEFGINNTDVEQERVNINITYYFFFDISGDRLTQPLHNCKLLETWDQVETIIVSHITSISGSYSYSVTIVT